MEDLESYLQCLSGQRQDLLQGNVYPWLNPSGNRPVQYPTMEAEKRFDFVVKGKDTVYE